MAEVICDDELSELVVARMLAAGAAVVEDLQELSSPRMMSDINV
ncbi:hypothetical protein ACFY2D_35545 [Streptomyces nigra]